MERMRGGHYEVDTQEFKVPALVKHINDPRTQAEWAGLTTIDPFGDPPPPSRFFALAGRRQWCPIERCC